MVLTIGRLDRALSELKMLAKTTTNEADRQTIKHHAEDCVLLGLHVLNKLAGEEPVPQKAAIDTARSQAYATIYDYAHGNVAVPGKELALAQDLVRRFTMQQQFKLGVLYRHFGLMKVEGELMVRYDDVKMLLD